MRNSSLLILEIVWWATGIISILLGIRVALTEGGIRILIFVLMAIVSFLFAWMRHKQRKKS